MKYLKFYSLLLIALCFNISIRAIDNSTYVSLTKEKGTFSLSEAGIVPTIYTSTDDFTGVLRAAKDLQTDIEKVTGIKPVFSSQKPEGKLAIIIGTIGKSSIIDQLIANKKIDVNGISGKWETFIIQVVNKPMQGLDQALVIAGSDKRGTIYGIYDISEKIGVSPWYWWADVPVKKNKEIFIRPDKFTLGEPAVKYRGIFINDEAPNLSGFVHEKFGGFNSKFYVNVFELILRLKGNFLWPAMWGRAFYDDDTLNPKLADEYGVVIGTSHHEPMVRAHDEWRRYGKGKWNYDKNDSTLRDFWRKGIQRMNGYENLVTVGMRGDGDEPMSEESNIALLERIVKDQRQIIQDVTGKEASATPQVWALYKEVQEYYDRGMRVPDDVTLLLCDDNWGNIRKLPKLGEKPRKGGYGIYYHYDYVGGPRNYKWVNTNPIAKVWEQMHLAYEYNARQIWIVNVGDIKPMEFPITFFLDYAWNPEKWPANSLQNYTNLWAEQQFGKKDAEKNGQFITDYLKYNSRKKPELLSPETYSIINYNEADKIVNDYNKLAEDAIAVYNSLPVEYKDAYYQLILHPVIACANLNNLYVVTAKNRLYAKQGRAITNILADSVERMYIKDSLISVYYNTKMSGGKWNHMADQTHIGYTYWQQPDKNSMPKVFRIENEIEGKLGVAIEGNEGWWPNDTFDPVLPEFDVYRMNVRYFDIYNRGKQPFNFTIKTEVPWINVSAQQGKIDKEQRIFINIDWAKVPSGTHRTPINIKGPEEKGAMVYAVVQNPATPKPSEVKGFIEVEKHISIEAAHYSKAVETDKIKWLNIPNLGRTLSGVTPIPVTSAAQVPQNNSPHLQYNVYITSTDSVKVNAYFSPTLDFQFKGGLNFAVSFDDETPQTININEGSTKSGEGSKVWEQWVANNCIVKTTRHKITKPGSHVLKIWMVDPGVVLQKIVIDLGGVKPSYLGPPESYFKN